MIVKEEQIVRGHLLERRVPLKLPFQELFGETPPAEAGDVS
jgi:hypothetical protein